MYKAAMPGVALVYRDICTSVTERSPAFSQISLSRTVSYHQDVPAFWIHRVSQLNMLLQHGSAAEHFLTRVTQPTHAYTQNLQVSHCSYRRQLLHH